MLSYSEAQNLLIKYGQGEPWTKHCLAVSKLAVYFSEIFKAKYTIDIPFLQRAALLHDIGRYKTHDPFLHGVAGYELLNSLGHKREAFVCASHVLAGFDSAEALEYGLPEQDFFPMSFEEKLIPLLDCLADGEIPSTLDKRFSFVRQRYLNNEKFLLRLHRFETKARDLMEQLDKEFNISMEKMAREVLTFHP